MLLKLSEEEINYLLKSMKLGNYYKKKMEKIQQERDIKSLQRNFEKLYMKYENFLNYRIENKILKNKKKQLVKQCKELLQSSDLLELIEQIELHEKQYNQTFNKLRSYTNIRNVNDNLKNINTELVSIIEYLK